MSQVADMRSPKEIAESHPFLEWFGRMAVKGVAAHKRDVVLDRALSGRFVLGIEDDGELTLGIQTEDAPHLLSIPWERASMIRNFRGSDWLVLVHAEDDADKSIRLFIPMASIVADRFKGFPGTVLRIRRSRYKNGISEVAKEPQAEMPLKLKGF